MEDHHVHINSHFKEIASGINQPDVLILNSTQIPDHYIDENYHIVKYLIFLHVYVFEKKILMSIFFFKLLVYLIFFGLHLVSPI